MLLYYRCSRCRKAMTDLDILYHNTINSFDKQLPNLCFRCEMKIDSYIDFFLNSVLE